MGTLHPNMTPIIIIPARLGSIRLPNKPIADIAGLPMIVRVWQQAMAADVGPVVVACGDKAIYDAVWDHGGNAVMTDPDLPSGSDRVAAAVQVSDPGGEFDPIVNVQGDLPLLDQEAVVAALRPLERSPEVDVSTLASVICDPEEADNPNVVKVVTSLRDEDHAVARALYFTRAQAPAGDGPLWHHIGLYAYRRAALARFVASVPSVLELRENLEQLRGLENGLRYDVARVDTVPFGVDTPDDLARVRAMIEQK